MRANCCQMFAKCWPYVGQNVNTNFDNFENCVNIKVEKVRQRIVLKHKFAGSNVAGMSIPFPRRSRQQPSRNQSTASSRASRSAELPPLGLLVRLRISGLRVRARRRAVKRRNVLIFLSENAHPGQVAVNVKPNQMPTQYHQYKMLTITFAFRKAE